jgi:pyridoxamine 5'-phosphate oxidase
VTISVTTTQAGEDFTTANEPFALFATWMGEATASEVNDPNAMALATVDQGGMPNVRMVLLKGLDDAGVLERGFVFYTNTTSAKGRELIGHPKAGLAFHWKSLRRQVRVRGPVTRVSDAEADAYYATRPRGSRIGAWASDQSQPLTDRGMLEASVAKLEAQYGEETIPRPPHWTGFRVTPLEIEFWHDRPFRLHDRIVFARPDAASAWSKTRLYP